MSYAKSSAHKITSSRDVALYNELNLRLTNLERKFNNIYTYKIFDPSSSSLSSYSLENSSPSSDDPLTSFIPNLNSSSVEAFDPTNFCAFSLGINVIYGNVCKVIIPPSVLNKSINSTIVFDISSAKFYDSSCPFKIPSESTIFQLKPVCLYLPCSKHTMCDASLIYTKGASTSQDKWVVSILVKSFIPCGSHISPISFTLPAKKIYFLNVVNSSNISNNSNNNFEFEYEVPEPIIDIYY